MLTLAPISVALESTPGCGQQAPAAPGATTVLSLSYGDLERSYRLHLPPNYVETKPASLVLTIHGYTGSAEFSERQWTRMSQHSDAEGYVVVYPDSTSFETTDGGPSRRISSWNDLACSQSPGPLGPTCAADAGQYPCPPECGDCGPCNWCSCQDDVGFVEALLDELESKLCLDKERIYANGFSNGGMFVHRLGCVLGHRLTAVAPLAGTLARGFNCAPGNGEKVSLLLLSGVNDRTVPLDGSRASDGYFYTPNRQVAASWSASQGCSAERTQVATPWDGVRGLTCEEHRSCQSGARVMDCRWKGEHNWPRVEGKEGSPDIAFGNDLLWWFFDRRSEHAEP